MEDTERQRIRELAKSDFQLHKLYREHENLEEKLSLFGKRSYLTVDEQVEEKRLKIRKLRGVDQMMRILSGDQVAA